MHGRRLTATALSALSLAGVAGGAGTAVAAPASVVQPALERALVREMNAARAAYGRAPLGASATLARPARVHSAWLAQTGVFQHEGPGETPFWSRLRAAGYPADRAMGENIALVSGCGADAARQIVRLWLNSPGHRAILLSPRFRYSGAGIVSTPGCETTLATADYGG